MPDTTPKYIFFIVALAFAVLVVLTFQVVFVRIQLSKYDQDDYYKQLLVKNEYVNNVESCSNFGVYAVTVETSLIQIINHGDLLNKAVASVQLPLYVYTIPTKNGFQSIEYVNYDVIFLPLTKSPGTARLVNDILKQRVDYVTWSSNLFRISVCSDYKDKMQEYLLSNGYGDTYKAMENMSIIVLTKIPSLDSLKEADYQFGESIDSSTPATIIHSFIGTSQSSIDFGSFSDAAMLHLVGYKV